MTWYPPSMSPEHTLRLLCSENGVTSCTLLCHQTLPRLLELTKLLFSLLFQHKMGQQLLNSPVLQRRKSGPRPCPPGCFPFRGKGIWREVCTFPQIVVYCLSLWFKSLVLAVTSAIDWPIMLVSCYITPHGRFFKGKVRPFQNECFTAAPFRLPHGDISWSLRFGWETDKRTLLAGRRGAIILIYVMLISLSKLEFFPHRDGGRNILKSLEACRGKSLREHDCRIRSTTASFKCVWFSIIWRLGLSMAAFSPLLPFVRRGEHWFYLKSMCRRWCSFQRDDGSGMLALGNGRLRVERRNRGKHRWSWWGVSSESPSLTGRGCRSRCGLSQTGLPPQAALLSLLPGTRLQSFW